MNAWSNIEPARYLVSHRGETIARSSLDAAMAFAEPGDTVIVEMCRVTSGLRQRRYERAMTL